MKPESGATMVDDANIMLTSLKIICNYIRDSFRKFWCLPKEAVHNLRTGYMKADYGTYAYEKEKSIEKEHINFWYIQSSCLLTLCTLPLTNDCSCHFLQHHPQLLPSLLVYFLEMCVHLPTTNILETLLSQVNKSLQMKILPFPGCHEVQSAFSAFSEFLTRAGFGDIIYLGITKEASHIFYGWFLLMKGLLYSLLALLQRQGGILRQIERLKELNGGNLLITLV